MFYRYEHYMSISHMALIVAMVHFNPATIRKYTQIDKLIDMLYTHDTDMCEMYIECS